MLLDLSAGIGKDVTLELPLELPLEAKLNVRSRDAETKSHARAGMNGGAEAQRAAGTDTGGARRDAHRAALCVSELALSVTPNMQR